MKEDLLGLVGRVFDQLRFDELVDEGGFGYVYRGVHLGMDEAVAIKCLKMQTTSAAMAQSFEKRFKDETRMAYRLSQGNLDIVRCISSGSLMAGDRVVPYMVLEWLDGHSLRAELAARRDAGRARWSLREAVDTLDSAAQALAFAHRRGVVHRDVKPGNLFLARTASGTRAKVLDFGVAKIVDPSAFMARGQAETGTQELIASPAYGAPEQLSNEREKVGPHTDVYSLALVLLEMLLGTRVRPPSKSFVEAMLIASDPRYAEPTPRKLGLTVDDAVEAVFARATTNDTTARYAEVGELWAALRAAAYVKDAASSATDAPTVKDKVKGEEKAEAARGPGSTVSLEASPVTIPIPTQAGTKTLALPKSPVKLPPGTQPLVSVGRQAAPVISALPAPPADSPLRATFRVTPAPRRSWRIWPLLLGVVVVLGLALAGARFLLK